MGCCWLWPTFFVEPAGSLEWLESLISSGCFGLSRFEILGYVSISTATFDPFSTQLVALLLSYSLTHTYPLIFINNTKSQLQYVI